MLKIKKKRIKIFHPNKLIKLERLFSVKNCSPNYVRWLSDKKINQFLEVRFVKINKKDIIKNIKKTFNSNTILLMGIYLRSKIKKKVYDHVGNVKADINDKHLNAEVSVIIGESKFHNQGISSKSIYLFSNYLFKKLKIQKLHASVYEKNIYSVKAFQSAGYKITNILKKHRIYKNKRCDEIILSKMKKK